MRRVAAAAAAVSICVSVGISVGMAGSVAWGAEPDPQNFTQVEKGRYLTLASDCMSCHTVPGSGSPFAGGRIIETPFGGIVAPNITPDRETGIGAWSDAEFDAALRRGVRRDGALLYPAMPYNAYTKMSREDVQAIRAYLATVTPVKKLVIAKSLPFPFRIRSMLHLWNALYFTPGEYEPDSARSAEWNRGAFLVKGPAHCGACHTPKTALGGDKRRRYLQGAEIQGWFAPDITNDSGVGLGGWSAEDFVAYMKTGHNRVSAATGPMAEAVSLSSSQMTNEDLGAIATYLKTVAGGGGASHNLRPDDPVMQAGAAIYRDQCSACHGLDGKGIPRLFPSVADSTLARSVDPTTSIRIVLRGARSVATAAEPTAPDMPSYGWQLSDDQVAAVLTYIRNTWGGSAAAVSPRAVAKVRATPVSEFSRLD